MYLLSSKKMFPSLCVTIINPILCRKANFYYKLSPTIHMTYCMKNVTESSDILWRQCHGEVLWKFQSPQCIMLLVCWWTNIPLQKNIMFHKIPSRNTASATLMHQIYHTYASWYATCLNTYCLSCGFFPNLTRSFIHNERFSFVWQTSAWISHVYSEQAILDILIL